MPTEKVVPLTELQEMTLAMIQGEFSVASQKAQQLATQADELRAKRTSVLFAEVGIPQGVTCTPRERANGQPAALLYSEPDAPERELSLVPAVSPPSE